jgi:hypothetical protein
MPIIIKKYVISLTGIGFVRYLRTAKIANNPTANPVDKPTDLSRLQMINTIEPIRKKLNKYYNSLAIRNIQVRLTKNLKVNLQKLSA